MLKADTKHDHLSMVLDYVKMELTMLMRTLLLKRLDGALLEVLKNLYNFFSRSRVQKPAQECLNNTSGI